MHTTLIFSLYKKSESMLSFAQRPFTFTLTNLMSVKTGLVADPSSLES